MTGPVINSHGHQLCKIDPTPTPRDCFDDSSDCVGEVPPRREILRLHSADAPFRSE